MIFYTENCFIRVAAFCDRNKEPPCLQNGNLTNKHAPLAERTTTVPAQEHLISSAWFGGKNPLRVNKRKTAETNPDKCRPESKPYKGRIRGFTKDNKQREQTNTHKFKKEISGVMTTTLCSGGGGRDGNRGLGTPFF